MLLRATGQRRKKLRRFFSGEAGAKLSQLAQDLGNALGQIERGELQGDESIDAYAAFIRRCRDERDAAQGLRLHEHIVSTADKLPTKNRYLCNLLIEMYGKCGRLDQARRVFDQLLSRNVYSWNIVVGVYVEHGDFHEAWTLFRRMQLEGAGANHVTFLNILSVCISTSAVSLGRALHAMVAGSSLEFNTAIVTAFVNMFGKCGQLETARKVFDAIDNSARDIVTWNAMITAYADNDCGMEGLGLLEFLLLEGLKLDVVTFMSLVSACANALALQQGKLVHGLVIEAGCGNDVILGNCLVNMYAKCGCLDDARQVFDGMRTKDLVTWNTMIAAHAQGELPQEALDLFQQMDMEPDKITFVALLDACANMESLEQGKLVHDLLLDKKLLSEANVIVQTALVNMYVKCGNLEVAKQRFEAMSFKDVVCWNAFLSAHTVKGHGKEALAIFSKMDLQGMKPTRITLTTAVEACANSGLLPQGRLLHQRVLGTGYIRDMVTCSTLINMYGKCKSLTEAKSVFEGMREKNVVSWTTMIAAYVDNDCGSHGIELFQKMDQEGVKPNAYTFGRVLDACANNRDVDRGLVFYRRASETGLDLDAFVGVSIINMLGKCNKLQEARLAFDRLPQKDVVPWNVLISGYIQKDEDLKALETYREMLLDGTTGDSITYMSVLDSCSRLGSLRDGKLVHAQLTEAGYETVDVVVSTLVNMYGKCGSPEEAKYLFDNKLQKKSVICWNAVMSAYAQNGDAKQAVQTFRGMDLEGVKADEISFISVMEACGQLGTLATGKLYHSRAVETGYGEATILCNALLNMYGRCGSLEEANSVFLAMGERKTSVSWNTMIITTAKRGTLSSTLDMFREMDLEGVKPNHISFISLLFACSHCGNLEQGRAIFQYMTTDHGVAATPEHYGCFIDLLGRAGKLVDAEELIQSMPVPAGNVEWMSLLGACEMHNNAEQGTRVMNRIDDLWAAPFMKISNLLRFQKV